MGVKNKKKVFSYKIIPLLWSTNKQKAYFVNFFLPILDQKFMQLNNNDSIDTFAESKSRKISFYDNYFICISN